MEKNPNAKKEQNVREKEQNQKKSSQPGQGGGQGDTPKPKGTKPEDWKNVPGNQS